MGLAWLRGGAGGVPLPPRRLPSLRCPSLLSVAGRAPGSGKPALWRQSLLWELTLCTKGGPWGASGRFLCLPPEGGAWGAALCRPPAPALGGAGGRDCHPQSRTPSSSLLPPPAASWPELGEPWVRFGAAHRQPLGAWMGRSPVPGLVEGGPRGGPGGPGVCARARTRVHVCVCVCVCLGVAAADTCRPHPGLSATSVGVSGGGEGHRKLRFCESESQPFPLPGQQPPTCCRSSSWRVVGSRLQPHSPALWGPGGCWGLFASALGSRPQLCLRLLRPPIQVRAGWTWDRVSQVHRGCTLRLSRPPSAPAPLPAWAAVEADLSRRRDLLAGGTWRWRDFIFPA